MAKKATVAAVTTDNGIATLPVVNETRKFWSEDITMDPATAQKWKDNYLHPHQRPLRRRWADDLANHLRRGTLYPTTLRLVHFDGKTYLNDGQHRIEAVIAAGLPADFTVQHVVGETMEDVRRDYSVIDRGLSRQHSDIIRIYEFSEKYNLKASSFNRASMALTWILTGFNRSSTNEIKRNQRDEIVRALAIQDWIDEIKWYFDIMHDCKPAMHSCFLRAPLMAVAFITLRHQLDQANHFWASVMRDDGLRSNDPQKALWRFLLNNSGNNADKFGHHHYYALAWNKFYLGEKVTSLRVHPPYYKPIEIVGTPYKGKKIIIPEYEI